MALGWEQVLAWRVARQHLTRRADDSLAVVRDIGGLHAQVMSSAQLMLAARAHDADAAGLLAAGALVKTWAQRGTLHLHAPEDLAVYVGAFATMPPRHHAGAWQRAFGLSRGEADALFDAVAEVLRGHALTRPSWRPPSPSAPARHAWPRRCATASAPT